MDQSSEEFQLLKDVYSKLLDGVPVADRRYNLSTYKKCFIGSEAVDFMVKSDIASSREEAVNIGEKLSKAGFLGHVTRDHPFKDAKLFFRFKAHDNTRGTNTGKTWDAEVGKVTEVVLDKENEHERAFDVTIGPLDKYNAGLLDCVHPRSWENPADTHFNLLVIGSGAGGLISAIQGGGLGIKTAIIEKHLMGGDCLNVGCVPSKALIRCARHIREVKSDEFGVSVSDVKIHFDKIMERMRKLRARIAPVDSLERYAREGVHVFQGTASFVGKNSVKVVQKGSEKTLTFGKCIVATGGRARVPPIPGLIDTKYLTNQSIFNLTELPKTFGVIGSGPIGCEMAQSFAMFGSQVHLFDMMPKILPREDDDAAKIVQDMMERDGVQFHFNSSLTRITQVEGGKGIKIEFSVNGEESSVVVDELLVSAGRVPNVEHLNLEAAGVKFNPKGIDVDDTLKTSNSNIYAVGDVCVKYQFTHIADAGAKIAFRNAMFPSGAGIASKVSKLVIPWATYTTPEIAHCGKTTAEMKEGEYDAFIQSLEHNDRAILEGEVANQGFVKMRVKKGTDEILGCTIVAENAGDLISEVTTCIANGIGARALSGVIHPYPTTADSIRLCAGQVNKTRLTSTTKALLRNLAKLKS